MKLWNCSLNTESKKHREMRLAGLLPKKTHKLARMSSKTKKRITDYRKACFAYWGEKCILCGRDSTQTRLVCHHMDGRINGDNVERLVPLCDKFCGCGAHNHDGMGDPRVKVLNARIEKRIKEIKGGNND